MVLHHMHYGDELRINLKLMIVICV